MSNCNHDCGSCSQNCSDRTQPESFLIQPHKESSIKKIIGVVSGRKYLVLHPKLKEQMMQYIQQLQILELRLFL